jgi:hypothetical protein
MLEPSGSVLVDCEIDHHLECHSKGRVELLAQLVLTCGSTTLHLNWVSFIGVQQIISS